VFYGAAVSESRAMHGQDVLIVGAGNSAGQAALNLARHARAVTILARSWTISKSISSYLVHAIESTPNVSVRSCSEVIDGAGDETLESITVADRAHGTVETLATSGLFIMIAGEPHTGWLPDEITRDRGGYLITGHGQLEEPAARWPCDREPLPLETSMPGVFAGRRRAPGSINRVASAVGDGATVVRLVHEHPRWLQNQATAQPSRPTAGTWSDRSVQTL
jgi:thioredoxin reductase (NADPH)